MLKIEDSVTLVKGTDSLTGIIKSTFASPELIEPLAGEVQGSYEPIWTAGYRIITLAIQTPANILAGNSILGEVEGVTEYVIDGDVYHIQSIEADSLVEVLITLVHNQGTAIDVNANLTLRVEPDGVDDHTFNLVAGSTLYLNYSSKYISFDIYKYSADDIYASGISVLAGFIAQRDFLFNGVLYRESWVNPSPAPTALQIPNLIMNDSTDVQTIRYKLKFTTLNRTLAIV